MLANPDDQQRGSDHWHINCNDLTGRIGDRPEQRMRLSARFTRRLLKGVCSKASAQTRPLKRTRSIAKESNNDGE